jgi:hypothetical protein
MLLVLARPRFQRIKLLLRLDIEWPSAGHEGHRFTLAGDIRFIHLVPPEGEPLAVGYEPLANKRGKQKNHRRGRLWPFHNGTMRVFSPFRKGNKKATGGCACGLRTRF